MAFKDVGGVPLGGEPGETASLLVGSMFYDRQKLVSNAATGEFDAEAAGKLLDLQDKWSQITGNPACVDVVASTPAAMRRYLDFVVERFDGPIMVDGSDGAVKIAGIEHLAAKGLSGRVIYNSISSETRPPELEAIGSCGVKAAVLLAVDAADFSAAGKLRLLNGEDGLIAKARAAGVESLLVDTGVIDLPSVGLLRELIAQIKELGCLCGAAPHNAIGTWGGLTSKLGASFKPAATAVLNALPIAWGGDFVIYGPLSLAPTAFPAVAMADTVLAQSLMEQGKIPGFDHPMFKIA
jgi:N5-methyltetrahydromethanopterin:coenzyme M methyltransferase subunit H